MNLATLQNTWSTCKNHVNLPRLHNKKTNIPIKNRQNEQTPYQKVKYNQNRHHFFWTIQEQIADMMLYHPQILCFSKKQGYPTQTSVLPFKPGNHHWHMNNIQSTDLIQILAAVLTMLFFFPGPRYRLGASSFLPPSSPLGWFPREGKKSRLRNT